MIRTVPENEKGSFYKRSGTICGIIAAIWLAGCIVSHPGVEEFFEYMLMQYRIPGLVKVIGSYCSIMLVFAVSFWITPFVEKWKFGYNKLCYYSRHISKMYAVHIGVYFLIGGFSAFYEFSVAGCLLLSVAVLIATDLIVEAYVIMENKIKNGKKNR